MTDTEDHTRPSAEGNIPARRPRSPSLVTALLIVLGLALGLLLPTASSLVFVVVLLAVALPLVNARPVVWVGLALALPWVSRLLTTTGLAPRVLDFLDFPLVLIAFAVAGVRYLDAHKAIPPEQRRVLWAVVGTGLVIAGSWAFQDLYEPARFLAGLILALEPFLLLAAIIFTPLTHREQRGLIYLTVTLLCVQIVFSGCEIVFSGARTDDVKGTLLETGAGHHVSAGGLALALLLLVGLRARTPIIVTFGVLALGVMVVADAKQVLFVVPLAALVLGVMQTRSRSALSLVGGLMVGLLMAGVAGYAIYSYQASQTALQFVDDTATEDTGKAAVISALWTDINASPDRVIFGLGPGESVSRFAFLTTGALIKEGSPVNTLGLHISRGADKYNDLAFGGKTSNQSSFTSAQSSALGIIGDYGLAGCLMFSLLILSVLRALMSSPDRGLRAAALASWTLLLPLAVVFDWLEQPPFTLAVVVITGLALRADRALVLTPVIFKRQRVPRAFPSPAEAESP